MMPLQAGRLRHRITIQQYTATRDGSGGEIPTWSDVATVWASVEPISGKEYFAAAQVNAEVTHKIRIRYRDGVTPKMRISFASRNFYIEAVLNIQERNREIHLMCREDV